MLELIKDLGACFEGQNLAGDEVASLAPEFSISAGRVKSIRITMPWICAAF
jgi:hypothetical protein